MMVNALKTQFLAAEKEAGTLKAKTREIVLKGFGSAANFCHALTIHLIDQNGDDNFKAVYQFYTSFFTLPEETESFDGFESTLRLNSEKKLTTQYGRFKEAWLYTCLPGTKEIIAGVNFSVYEMDEKFKAKSSYCATGHIIYIFVKPEYRSLGLAKFMLNAAEKRAEEFIGNREKIIWFCEQNAPEKMTHEEYFEDNLSALIDQCERLIWWDKLGYKRLNFNYIQPPLNPGQKECTNLTLNVKVENQSTIPSFLVYSHLKRFFMIAVFKGNPNRIDKFYRTQLDWLVNNTKISLSGDAHYYASLKSMFYESM